jgi:hypothetical protein
MSCVLLGSEQFFSFWWSGWVEQAGLNMTASRARCLLSFRDLIAKIEYFEDILTRHPFYTYLGDTIWLWNHVLIMFTYVLNFLVLWAYTADLNWDVVMPLILNDW